MRTPRAEELRGPGKDIILAAERLWEQKTPFDPATAVWELVVAMSDRLAELLLPTLDRFVTERAPLAHLSIRTMTTDLGGFLREHGGLAILPEAMKDRDLRSERLFAEDSTCLVRRGHPVTRRRWTTKRFAELEHVLVTPLGVSQRSVVDALLAKEGLSRRITRVVTSFALAAPLVAHSDRVVTLPRSTAVAHAKAFDLELRPLPVEVPPTEMCLAWHHRSEADPKHAWARTVLHDAVRGVGMGADARRR